MDYIRQAKISFGIIKMSIKILLIRPYYLEVKEKAQYFNHDSRFFIMFKAFIL